MHTKMNARLFPRGRLGKRYPGLLLPAFLILAFLMGGCGAGPGGGEITPTPYPTPVRATYTVQRGDIVINAKFTGQVEAVALQTVSFQMDGNVDHVYVQLNEKVTKGQLLADLVELKELETKADTTRHAVQRAEIDLQIAQELLAKYRSGGYSSFDVKIQELQVQLAQIGLDEVLSQYSLADASTSLEAIAAQVDQARVYAPVDGVIVSRVTPERVVTTSTAAFVIGNPDQLEVVTGLETGQSADQLPQMFEGMPVSVTLEARPEVKLTGKIRQLPSPYGTGATGENKMRIVLDQTPSLETYQSGDKVTVQVQLANKLGILWLPPTAIHQVGGRTFVITSSDTGPQRVEIVIGLQTPDKIEILSGLNEGQVVIGR
jgi:RND family efflux transporter MFP subunit